MWRPGELLLIGRLPLTALFAGIAYLVVSQGVSNAESDIMLNKPDFSLGWWKVGLAAIPGFLSLGWNVFQSKQISKQGKLLRQRDYALDAFNRDVAGPVNDALECIDSVVSDIEASIEINEHSQVLLRMEEFLEGKLHTRTMAARRKCREADEYLSVMGFSGNLENTLVDGEINFEDALAQCIEKVSNAEGLNHRHRYVAEMASDIGRTKALVRQQLTNVGYEVGKRIEDGFDLRN